MLAWLLHYMQPYRRDIALLAMLSTFEIALRILLPWPMQAVVDYALGSQSPPAWLAFRNKERLLIAIVATGLGIQLAHHLIMMFHTRIQASTGQHMIRDLRKHLFAHFQNLALIQHSKMPKGDSVNRLEADASCVDFLLFGGLFPFGFSLLTLLVMLVVLAQIDLKLALISLVVVPVMFMWLKFHTRRTAPRLDQARRLESKLSERTYETFASIGLVKSFARERYEVERFDGSAKAAMEANIQLGRHGGVFSIVIALLTITGNSLVLVIGGRDVIHGDITLGTLLVVVAYLAFIYGPLSAIAQTTGNLQRALASARRVRESLALTPEPADVPGAIEATNVDGEIRFEGVSFHYDNGPQVLTDVSFTARPGETLVFVGPSGAGKSTLASLIARSYEASAGNIRIDDIDIRKYSLRSLRENIAVVHQDVLLTSGSILENLRYGRLDASRDAIESAAKAAHANEFILKLPNGYETNLGESGVGLSGGQRQRLAIARAFLKDAPILILDEPTSALDSISEMLVFDALRQLREGRTTFVIAHRLSTIREADRILVMDNGRIVAEGTDDQLLRTCRLYRQLCAQLITPEIEILSAR
jgi:ABC-type multidrug transport system fused ATPase/permease subunit